MMMGITNDTLHRQTYTKNAKASESWPPQRALLGETSDIWVRRRVQVGTDAGRER